MDKNLTHLNLPFQDAALPQHLYPRGLIESLFVALIKHVIAQKVVTKEKRKNKLKMQDTSLNP